VACKLDELRRLAEQYAQAVTRRSWNTWMNAHERRDAEETLLRAQKEFYDEIARIEGVIDHLGEYYDGKV